MRKNEQKKFPSNPRSLSEISTDVSVLILETLRRLGLYTRETYERGSDTILSWPKNGCDGTRLIPPRQVSLNLDHNNKITEIYVQLKNTPKIWLSRVQASKYYNRVKRKIQVSYDIVARVEQDHK